MSAEVAREIGHAVKASGAIVRVEPEGFLKVVERSAEPLVVTAPGGLLSGGHEYLTSYKGLIFFTSSPKPLDLPASAERIDAERIWVPR
jgi:hypothetical protein